MLDLTWFDSPLGRMVAVANDHALLLLEFEGRKHLQEELESLAATAELRSVKPTNLPPVLAQVGAELAAYYAGDSSRFDTPLELRGTEFQRRTWQALLEIPAGTTVSYQQLADTVGNPKAVRAVAAANGRNEIAVIVPCHRVIGSDGKLTGYAAGLDRKRWLIEHERSCFGSRNGAGTNRPLFGL